MNQPIASLQSSGPPPLPMQYSAQFRLPGQFACPDAVVFEEIERGIRRHLFEHILPSRMMTAERFLVIQGEPGAGKSVAACDAALRFGFAVLLLSASMLASEHEGGATAALDAYLGQAVRFSREQKVRVCITVDDFDLGICGSDANTGKTVNSDLLTQRLQFLADNRQHYRNFDDTGLPFVFTGNDFTKVRSSLFRDGRASWLTHAPSYDDKLQIAFQLLKPRSSYERRFVEKLARTYRAEPVAFWRSLKNDLVKAQLDTLAKRGASDIDAAEAELAKGIPFDPGQMSAMANARAKIKPFSFL